MSGIVKIDGRDVPFEGPYILVQGQEIPVATNGARVEAAGPLAKGAHRSARNIRKDVPTFASIQASAEISTWLPDALWALRQVIDAAIAGDPNDPTVTAELRLNAVRNSAAQFSDELLQRVATAIVGQAPAADVAKRASSSWRGWL